MVSQLGAATASPTSAPRHRPFLHVIEGTIQIFTCTYRGFFTHVMAQALRAAGQGTPVLVVQFLKGGINQGLENPVQLSQNLDWLRCDLSRCIDTPHLETAEREALLALWQHTREVVMAGQYALVVLDELSLAIRFGLIPEAEVVDLLKNRPPHIDVILTGPDMPDTVLEMADQVTELRRSPCP